MASVATEPRCGWEKLPKRLKLQVLSNLDFTELGTVASVSKQWQTLSEDDRLWDRLLNSSNMNPDGSRVPVEFGVAWVSFGGGDDEEQADNAVKSTEENNEKVLKKKDEFKAKHFKKLISEGSMCPSCKGRCTALPIAYGYPSSSMFKKANEGKLILGG
eukprot:TRINITY_DN1037_c0_g1_i1.p1 TRINITY_DN1037_c0_g1~~TRINITY_DN1037_c0_g1_i1.p1  ORF type:complete len:159 (-),score=19.89 TRINITY_DN1037_c0_g1_i1:334-810(-)